VLRWHAKRKAEVVLRLVRGGSLDALSRELGVPIGRLEQWRDEGLAGLEDALQARASDDPLRLKLDEANRRIGEMSMEIELLRARCEKNGPFVGRRSKR
jgi:transposase-like protein